VASIYAERSSVHDAAPGDAVLSIPPGRVQAKVLWCEIIWYYMPCQLHAIWTIAIDDPAAWASVRMLVDCQLVSQSVTQATVLLY